MQNGYWGVVFKFFYFSVTLMTTTGYGDVLSPQGEFAQACVCFQMLASAFYLQIILALGVSLVSEQAVRYERASVRRDKHPTSALDISDDSTDCDAKS